MLEGWVGGVRVEDYGLRGGLEGLGLRVEVGGVGGGGCAQP